MAGPRTTVEAQAFYRMYHSYADIPNPWDRLRWCRYGLDLLQKEVADHAKVGRTSIRCWETGQKTISQKCFCHLVENLGSDFPSMLRM